MKNNNNNDDYEVLLEEKKTYDGYQVWEFKVNTNELDKLNDLLEKNEISILGSPLARVDILVRPDYITQTNQTLRSFNISHKVKIDNLQKVIDDEIPREKLARSILPPPEAMGNLTWDTYYNLEYIYSYLDYIAKTHPHLCKLMVIGQTHEKRPIKLLKISNGNYGNRAILVDGGIHAREWASPATVTYIINEFIWNFSKQPIYVQNIDWYFIPILNPDGYKYSWTNDRMWRKNRRKNSNSKCYGVDLNRNFNFKWGPQGASSNPCSETYRGPKPFSEPESRALNNFIHKMNADWWAYLSFHTYGQYILVPYAYAYEYPPDFMELNDAAKEISLAIQKLDGTKYTVGNTAQIFYPAAGGSDDWAKGAANFKYSNTIELMDNGRFGFILPSQFILQCGRQGLTAVKTLANRVYGS